MQEFERIATIIRDVLDNDDLKIGADDSSETIEGWDSLAHVRIVLAVEQEFATRFDVEDIPKLGSVRALADAVG